MRREVRASIRDPIHQRFAEGGKGVKLLLACFWFLVAISILAVQAFKDKLDQPINLFGGKYSLGVLAVFAIFLGLFNLARWWLERSARLKNRQAEPAWANHIRRRIRNAPPQQPTPPSSPNPALN